MIFGKKILILLLFLPLILFAGCRAKKLGPLSILSFPEHRILEPYIKEFEKENRTAVTIEYLEGADFIRSIQDETLDFDALWPANDLWIDIAETNISLHHREPIVTSPVVFGVKKEIAREFQWIDASIYLNDIYDKVQSGMLSYVMGSATQTNSGACAYFGFLSAFPETLDTAEAEHQLETLLKGVTRTSGSTQRIQQIFLRGNYDALVHYESEIIRINEFLTSGQEEPLYLIYPVESLLAANSPLIFTGKTGSPKERTFLKLQEYLLSSDVQSDLSGLGYRSTRGTLNLSDELERTYTNWGVSADPIDTEYTPLSADFLKQALHTFQTRLRKPSITVFCLDYSGSMAENGGFDEMKTAMRTFLNQETASSYMAGLSKDDITIVFPYSITVLDQWIAEGNDQDDLDRLYLQITSLKPRGTSDIYTPILTALDILAGVPTLSNYLPAVILITDGVSDTGRTLDHLRRAWNSYGIDLPVYPVLFRNADEQQLEDISELTGGFLFDGRDDLSVPLFKIKGYN